MKKNKNTCEVNSQAIYIQLGQISGGKKAPEPVKYVVKP
jgi:hypothetical protein